MSRVGTRLELRVDGVAHGGWCVGRHDEQVVFVRHALPGERVRVLVTEETKRFLRADAVEVLEASPDRVEAPCRFAGPGKCGGCDWQHASLPAQRAIKARVVTEQLRRIAGIELDRELVVEELPGAPDGLGWRTRVRYAVDSEGNAGLRRHRSHELELIDSCPIAHPEVERLGVTDLDWSGVSEVEAVSSGSTADSAVIVTPRGARLPALPQPKASSALLRRFKGGRTQPIKGRRGVRENAAGREWRVGAGGFWQVHPAAADTLTAAVLAALEPKPGETALDLYCGAGLFAGALAEVVGPEGRVMGVEGQADAVRDAHHNLRDVPQARVDRGDVASRLREWSDLRADVAVLDPPRAGAGTAVVRALGALRPRRVAYVSCDPATLARDIAAFAESGYELADLRGFDAFPMTHHVECLAVLERVQRRRR
ncbi:tRNA/tmRNA/rRNA uracil-C5-methylase (TrmA/RlmC/RlmD family) [Spinactinospora alkalitolerans]|uniref:tRNA/tmRNA/rRNA uracil-C5-methylase (TrmA/RlmC/RlmD family) n=1 Tax=Spinactinospora alkalitolerans TaxID=687207 RepID=A0A852TTX7_9ACTN|nr:class I SAM-dependent RNA methyltransferase [Spinactinospora alkalitolerans]NYE46757.1 tRNA/tmRNA/rRNA uracil-C5-methylase (TrmA/RlmC/RlmD family) [Spinactinospora alkalitolerans]